MGATARLPAWLWLKNHRRLADSLRLEVASHLDAVADLDERNAAIHAVVLPVESHCPLNRSRVCPRAGNRKRQRLGVSHSSYRKVALHVIGVGTGQYNLSKVPSRGTDAFTENLIELSSGVTTKTGTCARPTDGNTADAKRHRAANRIGYLPERERDDKTSRI
jgi:hypothetical protein